MRGVCAGGVWGGDYDMAGWGSSESITVLIVPADWA